MKKQYITPTVETIKLEIESSLLATSPNDVDIKDDEGTEVLSKEYDFSVDLWDEEEDYNDKW